MRGRQRLQWEWERAWGGNTDDDPPTEEPQQETMWEAEMGAVWQKEVRRGRLRQREERKPSDGR
jgi:hypothetical protein